MTDQAGMTERGESGGLTNEELADRLEHAGRWSAPTRYRIRCEAAHRLRQRGGSNEIDGLLGRYDYDRHLSQWATEDVAATLEHFAEAADFDHAFHAVLNEAADRLRSTSEQQSSGGEGDE